MEQAPAPTSRLGRCAEYIAALPLTVVFYAQAIGEDLRERCWRPEQPSTAFDYVDPAATASVDNTIEEIRHT